MYDFDKIVERRNTNAMNTDGFRQYIFHDDGTMTFPFKDEEFVRMWVADMEFETPEVIRNAMKDRIDKGIFGYTKVFDPEYYKAFEGWCNRRYGWTFPKEQLVTSPGIIPALYELVGYITAPDEKVLAVTPSYAYFKHAADFNGRELVCSDLINKDGYYTMDMDDLAEKAADPKTTLCIFCNPHNPTGRVWTEDELKAFGDICKKNNLWVISDEIHCDLTRKGMQHTPLGKVMPDYGRLITCMAPSKTFNMAGLMFSNVIIRDSGLMSTWKARHYDFENPISIAAAQAAYQHGEDWLNELHDYLDKNFAFTGEFLKKNLPDAKYQVSEATYLAWVDLSAYFTPDEDLPMFFANEAGVLLEGGDMFVQNSDCFIRLNLACPKSVLEEGLKRIAKATLNK